MTPNLTLNDPAFVGIVGTPAPAEAWYTETTRNNSVGFTKTAFRPYIIAHKNEGGTESTTSILLRIAKNDLPIGTMYGGIWNDDSPNPTLITTSDNSLDVSTLTSNPIYQDVTFTFSATDVLTNYSVGCWTNDNFGTLDNFPVVGVNITTGDMEYRISGSNWTNYADRLLTCTISG